MLAHLNTCYYKEYKNRNVINYVWSTANLLHKVPTWASTLCQRQREREDSIRDNGRERPCRARETVLLSLWNIDSYISGPADCHSYTFPCLYTSTAWIVFDHPTFFIPYTQTLSVIQIIPSLPAQMSPSFMPPEAF